jgi:hypothetical protein
MPQDSKQAAIEDTLSSEEKNKWLEILRQHISCEQHYLPDFTDPFTLPCNAAYVSTESELYYFNKFQGVFYKLDVDSSAFHTLRSSHMIKDNLTSSLVRSITDHVHCRPHDRILKEFESDFSSDKLPLLQGLLLINALGILAYYWEDLLKANMDCSLTIAKGLAILKANSLDETKYTNLFFMRPKLALSIGIILGSYKNAGTLTDETLATLKINIDSAENIAKQFVPDHSEVTARTIMPIESFMLPANDSPNRSLLVLTGFHMYVFAEEVEEKNEAEPVSPSLQPDTTSACDSHSEELEQKDDIYTDLIVAEIIESCKQDYEKKKPFARSTFLKRLPADGKISYNELGIYALNNQRSRTARFFVNSKVEDLPEGDYKNFWKKYLSEYKFSIFQRSHLIEKFIRGEVNTIDDIANYASSGSTRTHKILKHWNRS